MHQRPSWQAEPCPAWCVRSHVEDDHPDDRWHDSAATLVPVTALHREPGSRRWEVEPMTITIVTSRHVGDTVTATFVGREDRPETALNLTPESAARLAEAVAHHTASLGRA